MSQGDPRTKHYTRKFDNRSVDLFLTSRTWSGAAAEILELFGLSCQGALLPGLPPCTRPPSPCHEVRFYTAENANFGLIGKVDTAKHAETISLVATVYHTNSQRLLSEVERRMPPHACNTWAAAKGNHFAKT